MFSSYIKNFVVVLCDMGVSIQIDDDGSLEARSGFFPPFLDWFI